MSLKLTMISMLWLGAAFLYADPLHLIANGSFEETDSRGWAEHWRQWPEKLAPGAVVTIDTHIAHTGTHSLRISHRQQNSYSRADQIVSVTPRKRYMISCWIRGQDLEPATGAGGALLFIGRNGTGNSFRSLGPGHSTRGTFPWTRYEIGPVDVGEQKHLAFLPYLHKTSGTVWYDDIEIVELTPDLNQRLEQMRTRNILLQDLSRIETICRRAGALEEMRQATAMRQQISTANHLPTRLDRRHGPPFFPLQKKVHGILAEALHKHFPKREVAAWLVDPFVGQSYLAWPPPASTRQVANVQAVRRDVEQLALNLTNTTLRDIDVELALNPPPAEMTICWREVIPVETRDGIFIDDALPRANIVDGTPHLRISTGMTRQIWIEIRTGTTAGTWQGTLRVQWKTGRVDIPVNMRVYNLNFPPEWPLHTFCYAYLPTRPMTRKRLAIAAADLARHHINTIMPHGWAQGLPEPVFAENGDLQPENMDWSRFDAMLRLSTYAHTFVIPLPPARLKRIFAAGGKNPPFGSALWEKRAIAWIRAVQKGLRQRGIRPEQVLWTSVDEPSGANVDTANVIGRMLHRADPGIQVYSNFYQAATPADVRKLDSVVDVWAPALACLDNTYLPICTTRQRQLWAYRVQSKATPPASVRGAFWKLFATGVTGYSFWTYVAPGVDPWDPYDTDQHDYHVVYNGNPDEMIPSKRWEAWREGVEDYTLLQMLAQKTGNKQANPASTHDQSPAITERSAAQPIQQTRNRVLQALAPTP